MRLQYPITKTKAAFLLTCQRFFECYPNKVYFWTFTFTKVLGDEVAMMRWHQFYNHLWLLHGKYLPAIRVTEQHPAFYSHGIHFHCLFSRRLGIHLVKRIGARYGFGRMSVEKADWGTASYLSKYMSKEGNQLGKGMRKWGTLGGFPSTKVNNIEIQSQLTENIRWVQNHVEIRQFSYAFFLFISSQTLLYGKIQTWPERQLQYINRQNVTVEKMNQITANQPF